MSEMEHNKGKLIPFEMTEEYAKKLVEQQGEELTEDNYVAQVSQDLSWYTEDLEQIDGKFYTVEWQVQRGELYGFANVNENTDGSIDFDTYHHNGGAYWTEVVERALNK